MVRALQNFKVIVHIIQTDEGPIRFDLPDMERAFVLKSGRLYERDYDKTLVKSKEEKEEPESEREIEPIAAIVEQLNYRGEVENVDIRVFKNKLECECGNVRWVKNADLFQVKKCKPCTYRDRKERRKKGKKRNHPKNSNRERKEG